MKVWMEYIVVLLHTMKIINLPTMAEYHSSYNGCGLNFSKIYRGKVGQFKKSQEAVYYSHCDLLDRYANEYLNCFNYINIEIATDQINRYFKKRQQQIKRKRTKVR